MPVHQVGGEKVELWRVGNGEDGVEMDGEVGKGVEKVERVKRVGEVGTKAMIGN